VALYFPEKTGMFSMDYVGHPIAVAIQSVVAITAKSRVVETQKIIDPAIRRIQAAVRYRSNIFH